jgi:hypothetical protein
LPRLLPSNFAEAADGAWYGAVVVARQWVENQFASALRAFEWLDVISEADPLRNSRRVAAFLA